jgi:hypothetical protein
MRTKVLLLGIALLSGGCGQSETKPAVPAPVQSAAPREPWEIQRDKLMADVKVGMTEQDVTRVAGDPARAYGEADRPTTWEYDLPDKRHLSVVFDKSNQVARVEMKTAVPIQ